ncbi:hypothetical protein AWJ20_1407 [Sugiyamaella lignohabitans]|uniref:AB hydrolase-1 domain-containing protein n=1 Tax=Sugiyamaella lignohabitans TaxID=796027 RepID=A0A167DP61_9ASCO|nr:uncharacterized protein AWJ20_1407 [Sugiyamaella lignohabitans]ANB13126.1 hypothetical protein AWJ20_1407 [Sugiyamaella lignohabitans]
MSSNSGETRAKKSEEPTVLRIGGIAVYVYGLDRIGNVSSIKTLNAVYVLHPRLGDYTYSEALALAWLDSYYEFSTDNKAPLIAVTFDNRNHGKRVIDPVGNESWAISSEPNKIYNELHAQDMCSSIDGSVLDTSLVIDYLPSVLPFKVQSPIRNVIAGVSLGGHMAWRVAHLLGPDKVYAILPIIGSPNLSILLLERLYFQVLHKTPDFDFSPPWQTTVADNVYHQLVSSSEYGSQVETLLPRPLFNLVSRQDYELERHFPVPIKVFMLCGRDDPLVPAKYTEKWVASRALQDHRRPLDLKLYIQPNTGHVCTPEMTRQAGLWIKSILSSPPSSSL